MAVNNETQDELMTEAGQVGTEIEEHPEESKVQSFRKKFSTDAEFRHKFIHTMVLCWAFVSYGWIAGMTGPSFPDLGQIIQENLARSTWIFTVGAFGFMIGSLGGGALFDRFNKVALLAVTKFGLVISQLATPYCTKLSIMLIARFFAGLCCGALDTGANADIYYVWQEGGGSYTQALHFAFSIGALLAPIATGPFLAKKAVNCDTGPPLNTTQSTLLINHAHPEFHEGSNETNISVVIDANHCVEGFGESNVKYAFMLSACLCLTSAIGFLCLLCNNPNGVYTHTNQTEEDKKDRQKLSRSQKVFFLSLVCLQIASYAVTEDTFSSFLMTFCLAHLNWSKLQGSYASAAFWISFAFFRFLGIFITRWLKPEVLLGVNLTITTVVLVGFYIATRFFYVPMIWVSIVLIGAGTSVVFPAFFSWTSKKIIPVKGRVSSVIFTFLVLVGMGFPVVMGTLMETYGAMWFVNILLISIVFCLLHFVFMEVLVKFTLRAKTNKDVPERAEINETEMALIK